MGVSSFLSTDFICWYLYLSQFNPIAYVVTHQQPKTDRFKRYRFASLFLIRLIKLQGYINNPKSTKNIFFPPMQPAHNTFIFFLKF